MYGKIGAENHAELRNEQLKFMEDNKVEIKKLIEKRSHNQFWKGQIDFNKTKV